jgi:hypothetical protein
MFACDLALAVGLLVLAIRYSSMWLGAAMLLQSLGLGLHGLELVGDGVSRLGYRMAVGAMSDLMLLCVIGGTLASARRQWAERKGKTAPASGLAAA